MLKGPLRILAIKPSSAFVGAAGLILGGVGLAVLLPACAPRSHLSLDRRQRTLEELESNPNSPTTQYHAALLFADEKKYGEAEEKLREAIELDPSFAAAHYALGCKLLRLHPEEAEEELQIARNLDPLVDHTVGILFIGDFDRLKAAYDIDDACGDYDRVDVNSLAAYEFFTEIGYLYFLVNRFDEALRFLGDAISRHMYGLTARYYRANIMARRGNLARAIEELEFVVDYWSRVRRRYFWESDESKEDFAVLTAELAHFYNLDGEKEKAIECYLMALDANPEDALIHYGLAKVYGERDDDESMREHLVIASDLEPENHHLKCEVATLHLTLGETEKAIDLYSCILERHPRYAKAHYNLARAYELAGNPGTAVSNYRRFSEIAPRELEKYVEIARQKVAEFEHTGK